MAGRRELPSGIVTLLLTDVVGSTRAWQRSAHAMDAALIRHTTLIEKAVTGQGGVMLRHRGEGDSTFSVFGRASDAVRAALDAQRALVAESWPPPVRLSVRFALHSGEAIERDGDYFGPAVNRAARLRAASAGGDIVLSGTTADLALDDLPAQARLVDLGALQLRDIDRAERVFGLVADGISAPPVIAETKAPPSLETYGVTARESEVLAAVGERLTNAEIAARLFVSPRTVETHVAALMRKLGAANRRDLARIWTQFSLTTEPPAAEPRAGPFPTRLASLAAASSFVGRHEELTKARSLLDTLTAGEARTLLVVGEPGVGKTRLAAAIAAEGAARDFTVLYGRCEDGLAAPYQPVVEAFGTWLAACPQPALEHSVGRAASELAQLWPELSERVAVNPALLDADPLTQRWRLFESITELTRAMANERPLLLVMDDLQWAEPSTLLLLTHLVRRAVPATMIVATVRWASTATDPTALLGDVGSDRAVDLIVLAGLDAGEVGELVGAHVGGRPPDRLAEHLWRQTSGNPFFLTCLLAHLADVAFIRNAEGVWVTPGDMAMIGMPQGVRAVNGRRLASLSDVARRALEVAAVAGLTFDDRTVAGVLGAGRDEVLSALDEAVSAQIVREEDAGVYTFTHALMRFTVLEGQSKTLIARLHWRIADWLESDTRVPPTRIGEIAHHYAAGGSIGDAATIARTSIAAGEEARRRVAFEEATNHFRTALAATDKGPPDPDTRYRILAALGEALNALAQPLDAKPLWLEAARIAQDADDPDRLFAAIQGYGYMWAERADQRFDLLDSLLAMLSTEDSPLRAKALGWRAVPVRARSSAKARRQDLQMANDAVTMARRTGDDDALVSTLHSRLLLEAESPDAAAMFSDAEAALAMGPAGETMRYERHISLWLFTIALLRQGRRQQAEQHLALATHAVQQSGFQWAMNASLALESAITTASGRFADGDRLAADAAQLGGSRNWLAKLGYGAQILAAQMERGRLDAVISALQQVDQLADDYPAWHAMLAGALADAGRHTEASTEASTLIDDAGSGTTPGFGVALTLRYLPEVCRQLGNMKGAAALLPRLLPWTGQILVAATGTSIEGASDRSIGHLLATLGRHDEAATAYTDAANLERAAGFLAHVARTEYWHARLLTERDTRRDKRAAQELLHDVGLITQQLQMHLLAKQAAQLTRANAGRRPTTG